MSDAVSYRWAHYLTKISKAHTPTDFCVVDTEAFRDPVKGQKDKERQRLLIGSACMFRIIHGKRTQLEWLDFSRAADFWAWMFARQQKKRVVNVVAHGARYDMALLGLWGLLETHVVKVLQSARKRYFQRKGQHCSKIVKELRMCLDDVPFWMELQGPSGRFNIVDSLNYWQEPLERIGQWVGHPKLPMPEQDADLHAWRTYCARDVQIVVDALTELITWWKEKKYGRWAYTSAGLAMHAFRHGFLRHQLLIDQHKYALLLARASMAGGETQNYFIGVARPPKNLLGDAAPPAKRRHEAEVYGPVYDLDVKSCYGALMRGHDYPTRFVNYTEGLPVDRLAEWCKLYCCCAEVLIESKDATFPVLVDGDRHWAIGTFVTQLATPELVPAIAAGQVKACYQVAAYQRGRPFDAFVEHFFAERQAVKGTPRDRLIKMMLASLHGKFGQLTPDWRSEEWTLSVPMWGPFYRSVDGKVDPKVYRALGSMVQARQKNVESENSFPAISAHVTSYVRRFMLSLRLIAGEKNVLYQDTDCLHVLAAGRRRLDAAGWIEADTLGKLSERHKWTWVQYRGPKDYTADGIHVVSGLKRSAKEIRPGVFRQSRFPSFGAMLRTRPLEEIIVSYHERKLGRLHYRGVLRRDGYLTPVVVELGQVVDPPAGQRLWKVRS